MRTFFKASIFLNKKGFHEKCSIYPQIQRYCLIINSSLSVMVMNLILTSNITPLRITSESSSTLSRSLLSFANFSGVSLLRIPRTLRKMKSFRFSGVKASRLTVEGGIQRRSVDRERLSSLEGIELFSLGGGKIGRDSREFIRLLFFFFFWKSFCQFQRNFLS